MSGFTGAVTIATAVNRVTKFLQSVLDAFRAQKTFDAGAASQREKDLKDDTERNAAAREAATDPALDDPSGVLSDPANRLNKGK